MFPSPGRATADAKRLGRRRAPLAHEVSTLVDGRLPERRCSHPLPAGLPASFERGEPLRPRDRRRLAQR